jgi:hypothetical protein
MLSTEALTGIVGNLILGLWERGVQIKSKSKIKRSQPSAAPTGGIRTRVRSGRPVGRLALAFAVHAPSRPEPLRQPVTISIGASINNVDPRRVKADA